MENYLQEITGTGSFFDPVKSALTDVIDLYGKVQTIKLQNQLTQAQISAASFALPTPQQDAQAKAASNIGAPMGNNNLLMIGALVAGAIGLYLIVRK